MNIIVSRRWTPKWMLCTTGNGRDYPCVNSGHVVIFASLAALRFTVTVDASLCSSSSAAGRFMAPVMEPDVIKYDLVLDDLPFVVVV